MLGKEPGGEAHGSIQPTELQPEDGAKEGVSPLSMWFFKHHEQLAIFLKAAMLACFAIALGQKLRGHVVVMIVLLFMYAVHHGDSEQSPFHYAYRVIAGRTSAPDDPEDPAEVDDRGGDMHDFEDDWECDAGTGEACEFGRGMDKSCKPLDEEAAEVFAMDGWQDQEMVFAGEEEENMDAASEFVSKDRIDLLMRYMASVESQKKDQGPMTQRQRLQRKLLQRSISGKTARKEEDVSTAGNAVEDVQQPADYQLEELLKELDEPKDKRGSQKASARGPKRTAKRRGSGRPSLKASQSRPEEPRPEGDDDDDADEEEQKVAVPAAAESSDGDERVDEGTEDLLQTAGFQVVAKRRSRRTSRTEGEEASRADGGASPTPSAGKEPAQDRTAQPEAKPLSEQPTNRVRPPIIFGSLVPEGFVDDTSSPGQADRMSPSDGKAGNVETGTCAAADDANDEDWEWQCPQGYPLEPYICPEPLRCSSCGHLQPRGATALRSAASTWLACEACIRLAQDLPVESHQAVEKSGDSKLPAENCGADDASKATLDPKKMSALEIAEWFKQHGAEDALTCCMEEVLRKSVKRCG